MALVLFCTSWSPTGKIIVSTKTSGKEFRVNYSDKKTEIFKILKDKKRRYINVKNKRYYWDVDSIAYSKENIKNIIKANTSRPEFGSSYLPIMYMIFMIDEDGKVVAQGLDREFPNDAYQKEFTRLVSATNFIFHPAKIGDTKVASVLKINVDYYSLF
jgi:hypothetical protein